MNRLRSRWPALCAAACLAGLLVCPAPARAQTFVELGGGWNYVGPVAASGPFYDSGTNLRASIGWQVAPNCRWRIDAFTNQFDLKTGIPRPCPSFGCSGPGYDIQFESERVSWLTANGLVSVDARGMLYVIGGAGLYGAYEASVRPSTEWHFGVSAGAGIAVPVATHLRAFVEARWHGLFGDTAGPSQLAPITVGLRY